MKLRFDRKHLPLMICLPLAVLLTQNDPMPAEAMTNRLTVQIPDAEPMPVFVTEKLVDLSYLKQPEVGGLVGAYIGVKGKLPDEAKIDFGNQLQYLWDRKLEISNVSPATEKHATKVVERYRYTDPQYKSITEFVSGADQQARLSHASINYHGLCERMNLNTSQCYSLRTVAGKIGGEQLVAYGMTELFPSKSGKFNYILLDTLLRNAGESYIQSIPALGDKLLSLGFYQFTYHAIRHDETNIEGASVVNLFAADEAEIGGSVVSLTNEQQHRAAFFFAVYNLARLVGRLDGKEAKTLAESPRCSSEEVTQFIATAHHLPTPAIRVAARWIEGGCKKSYSSGLGPTLKLYAKKTRNNLKELEKRS